MGVQLSLKWKELRFERKYRRAIRQIKDFTPETDKIGRFLVQDGRKNLRARGSRVSNGRLAKSLSNLAFKLAAAIVSVVPYAHIQQEGGTITAKGGGMLAIPMDPGVAKSHTWPRHMGRGQLVRIKNILWRVKNGKLDKPWFVLVKQVTIRGRPYIKKSQRLKRYAKGLVVRKLMQMDRSR